MGPVCFVAAGLHRAADHPGFPAHRAGKAGVSAAPGPGGVHLGGRVLGRFVWGGLRPDVGLHRRPHRRPAGPHRHGAVLRGVGGQPALSQAEHPQLCPPRRRGGVAGAVGGLPVLLRHAGLQRDAGAVCGLYPPHRPDERAAGRPPLPGGGLDQRGVPDRQRRDLGCI